MYLRADLKVGPYVRCALGRPEGRPLRMLLRADLKVGPYVRCGPTFVAGPGPAV